MTSSRSASRSLTIFGIIALAGVASSALAGGLIKKGDLVPTRKAGAMYINMGTGERTLTRYDAELVPEIDAARSTASLFNYWMSIDENPCWEDPQAGGFGIALDTTADFTGGIMEPIVAWDFGDMPFDSAISGIVISTVTLASEFSDSNGDGVLDSGIDAVAVYYDAISEQDRSSTTSPTAVVRVESIPGNNVFYSVPGAVEDFDIIVDFAGAHFELGDSDGADLGPMWLTGAVSGVDFSATITTCTTTSSGSSPNCFTTANPSADGLADFQFLQYYAQHDTDSKVTEVSTFIGFAVPTGSVILITETYASTCTASSSSGCTFEDTIFVPDELPAGQGVFESFGLGALGPGGDTTNIAADALWPDYLGCCFWFGGIACNGFLDQIELQPPHNDTWYNFTPFAQVSHGFLSDRPVGTGCDSADFNKDGFIDSGDISGFISQFLSDAPAADLNNDGFIDSGDIGVFVELFHGCSG